MKYRTVVIINKYQNNFEIMSIIAVGNIGHIALSIEYRPNKQITLTMTLYQRQDYDIKVPQAILQ